MAPSPFTDPVQVVLDESIDRVNKARGLPPLTTQSVPAPADVPDFDGLSRRYDLPVNVLMALGEAGEKDLDSTARLLRGGLNRGLDIGSALTEGFGDPARSGAILERSYQIADEQFPEQPTAGAASKAEPEGFMFRLGSNLVAGGRNTLRSLDNTRLALSGWNEGNIDSLADNIVSGAEAQTEHIKGATEGEQNIRASLDRFDKTDGVLGTIGGALDVAGTAITNPGGVVLGTAEQLSNSIPSLAGQLAGGAAGAAAGSVIPGVGTAMGGIAGAMAGSAAGTVPIEFGAEIEQAVSDRLGKQGLPLTRENVRAVLSDPQMQDEITRQAALKGVTLAAVDSLFLGATGKIARSGLSTGRKIAAGTATEIVGEPVSEAASQQVARGEISKGDVAAEALYGAGPSLVSAGIETAAAARDARRVSREEQPPRIAGLLPAPNVVEPGAETPDAPVPVPEGPLGRALNAGRQEMDAAVRRSSPLRGQRVTVTDELGMMSGVVADEGDFGILFRSDDGQEFEYGRDDLEAGAARLTPEAAVPEQGQSAAPHRLSGPDEAVPSEDEQYAQEERAGILEHDEGLTREDAERVARDGPGAAADLMRDYGMGRQDAEYVLQEQQKDINAGRPPRRVEDILIDTEFDEDLPGVNFAPDQKEDGSDAVQVEPAPASAPLSVASEESTAGQPATTPATQWDGSPEEARIAIARDNGWGRGQSERMARMPFSDLHPGAQAKISGSIAQQTSGEQKTAPLEGEIIPPDHPSGRGKRAPLTIEEGEVLGADTAAHEAATSPRNDRPEPTQAQKEAGNYRLGHMKIGGLDISVEN
ncbi:hypothetical protein ACRC7T_18955, partial [Segnochrobactraceae bacterium EtOH-i3]